MLCDGELEIDVVDDVVVVVVVGGVDAPAMVADVDVDAEFDGKSSPISAISFSNALVTITFEK